MFHSMRVVPPRFMLVTKKKCPLTQTFIIGHASELSIGSGPAAVYSFLHNSTQRHISRIFI